LLQKSQSHLFAQSPQKTETCPKYVKKERTIEDLEEMAKKEFTGKKLNRYDSKEEVDEEEGEYIPILSYLKARSRNGHQKKQL